MEQTVSLDRKRVAVSVSLPMYIRGMLLAEAERQEVAFSALLTNILKQWLGDKGYPVESFEEVDDEAKAARKYDFLTAYSRLGTVQLAAHEAHISPATVYRWLAEDGEFAQAYQATMAVRNPQHARRPQSANVAAYMARMQVSNGKPVGNGRRPIRELPRRGEESAATEM